MQRVQEYIAGLDFQHFKWDYKTVDAVIRNFEIIGEASKNLPNSLKTSMLIFLGRRCIVWGTAFPMNISELIMKLFGTLRLDNYQQITRTSRKFWNLNNPLSINVLVLTFRRLCDKPPQESPHQEHLDGGLSHSLCWLNARHCWKPMGKVSSSILQLLPVVVYWLYNICCAGLKMFHQYHCYCCFWWMFLLLFLLSFIAGHSMSFKP